MKREKSIDHWVSLIGLGLLLVIPIAGMAEVDNGLSDSLRQALEAQGWQAEQAEDGSLIYRQPSTAVKKVQTQATTTKPLQAEDLKDSLRERGWRMEWSPSGSLILKPQTHTGVAPEEARPMEEVKPADRTSTPPGFEYWRIEKQGDGSLHFHPLAKSAAASNPVKNDVILGRCEGIEVKQTAVSLPVDQWGEAQALAQGWLHDTNLQGLLVGRIRKVLGVYLISLVDGTPPYHLQHQLAIRASDGRVILLE